mmetsp:Transcript_5318/g.15405  ORF Transcript_5318/g.15405 Transcript_5318/m.15405 type:complete len:241 (-) Transcript_5318:215-937(-)
MRLCEHDVASPRSNTPDLWVRNKHEVVNDGPELWYSHVTEAERVYQAGQRHCRTHLQRVVDVLAFEQRLHMLDVDVDLGSVVRMWRVVLGNAHCGVPHHEPVWPPRVLPERCEDVRELKAVQPDLAALPSRELPWPLRQQRRCRRLRRLAWLRLLQGRDFTNGVVDGAVARAAAEVALDAALHLLGSAAALAQAAIDGHDHPWRAHATLAGRVPVERLLDRVRLRGRAKVLDCRDLHVVN